MLPSIMTGDKHIPRKADSLLLEYTLNSSFRAGSPFAMVAHLSNTYAGSSYFHDQSVKVKYDVGLS